MSDEDIQPLLGDENATIQERGLVRNGPTSTVSSNSFRYKVYLVLESHTRAGNFFNYFIFLIIFLNVVCFIVSTEVLINLTKDQLNESKAKTFFDVVENFSLIVFSIEYVARVYAMVEEKQYRQPWTGRLWYMISFFALVDLAAILPFFIDLAVPGDWPATQFVRVFRLLRLLKVEGKYFEAFTTFDDVFRNNKWLLITSCFVGGAVWILFSAIMWAFEKDNEDQPDIAIKFASVPRSMFYSLLMMFGEFPVNDFTVGGKIVAGIASVVAVGVAAIPTGILGAGFMEIVEERRKKREEDDLLIIGDDEKKVCEQCEREKKEKNWMARIFYFLEGETKFGYVFQYVLYFVILINIISFIASTVNWGEPSSERSQTATSVFNAIELVSVIFFTIEYMLRVAVCIENEEYGKFGHVKGRLCYMISFFALVDLAAILPFYVDLCLPTNLKSSTFIRVFRLLRMFKAEKYIEAFTVFDDVIRANSEILVTTCFAGGVSWIFFSSLMYICEKDRTKDNCEDINIIEGFKSVPRSMWYTLLMMTGEFPLCDFTPWGQACAAVIGVFAVGVFAIPTGILGAGFEEWVQIKKEKIENEQARKSSNVGERENCSICYQIMNPLSETFTPEADISSLTEIYFENDREIEYLSQSNSTFLGKMCYFLNGNGLGFYFQIFIFTLIGLNVIIMIIDTIEDVKQNKSAEFAFWIVELISVVIFTLEFLLRFVSCSYDPAYEKSKIPYLAFLFSFFTLIDILAIVPFYIDLALPQDIPATTALRLFRLLLVVKFDRFASSFSLIDDVFREKKFILMVTGFVTSVLWVLFATLLYLVEQHDQQTNNPNDPSDVVTQADRFSSVLQALPYTLILLTGDYPLVRFTIWGKVICGVMIFLGVGLAAIPSGVIAAGFMEVIKKEKAKKSEFHNDDDNEDEELVEEVGDIQFKEKCVSCREVEAKERGFLAQLSLFMEGDSKAGRIFEYFILSLIVFNILAFILSTEETIENALGERTFDIIEIISASIFTVEYAFRVLAASENSMFSYSRWPRLLYLISFYSCVDLIAVLPFWIGLIVHSEKNSTIFRILRLTRLFKAEHYIEAFTVMDNVFRSQKYLLFVTMFVSAVIWVACATLQYYTQHVWLDSPYTHGYFNIPSSLFYTIILLGGEFAECDFNWLGQIVACFMCIIAIAIFSIPAGIFFGGFEDILSDRQAIMEKRENTTVYCVTCGSVIQHYAHLKRLSDEE